MSGKGRTRLTLRPGDPGTKRHVEQHGDRLVAVRYRYDDQASKRYTTVEIVVDERPWTATPEVSDPDRLVGLRIEYGEESLRRDVRATGGRWDPQVRLWWVPLHCAVQLGLENRIVRWSAPPQISNAG
jgi:hypothetical protein